jgi:hypothetical protein
MGHQTNDRKYYMPCTFIKTIFIDIFGHNWETIYLGPCDNAVVTEECIYVGNTGNNGAHGFTSSNCSNGREEITIYKFQETTATPNLSAVETPVVQWDVDVQTIRLSYRNTLPAANNDGTFGCTTFHCVAVSYDCDALTPTILSMLTEIIPLHFDLFFLPYPADAMFVDFTGDAATGDNKGDIYMFTKNPQEKNQMRIGKVPVSVHDSLDDGKTSVLYQVQDGGLPYLYNDVHFIGGGMSPDGRLIDLRTGDYVYYFPRVEGTSVSDLVNNVNTAVCDWVAPTSRKLSDEKQYEAVAFVGKISIAEASECEIQEACEVPVYIYDLVFPDSSPPAAMANPAGCIVTDIPVDDFTTDSWDNTNWRISSDNNNEYAPALVNENTSGTSACASGITYIARIA